MDSSVGPQSTWHLTDQSLSLFDNFGQLDSLDLLSGLEPASGTQQPGFPEHLSNDGGLHASSGNGSAGSGAEYDGLELIPQQAQQARHSAQAKAKELNKAAQKRFREKQKSKWQRLQDELAASTAATDRLKTENQQLNNKISLLRQAALLHRSEHKLTALPQQVMTWPSQTNSMLRVRREGRKSVTSTVNHTEEVISISQIARMAPQQFAITWQDYVRELAICLAMGGKSLQWDLNNASGRRMTQLYGELGDLCSAKARSNFEAHRRFASQPLLPLAEGTEGSPKPDWLALAHGLSLSEGQLKDVFLMRRAYLQKQALIQCKQQDLQLQLADAQSATARAHMLTVSQAAQQIQENDILLQESFMQYTGLVCDGVLSVWQTAMALVSTFPNPPNCLADLMDALADEAGEPNAASLKAAVRQETALDLARDSWMSIENHVYKAKMAALPVARNEVVAV